MVKKFVALIAVIFSFFSCVDADAALLQTVNERYRLGASDTREIIERFAADAVRGISQKGVTKGEYTGTALTLTGLEPLPEVDYEPNDPGNTRKLSTTTVEHSYGVAADGKVHSISYNSQKYFDDMGFNAVTYDNKSGEKYLYLTFDCGYENGNTGKILDVLKEKNVLAAFFCTLHQVESEPELTARMIEEGHIVGNHSVTHPNFSKITAEKMAQELEGFDNHMRQKYGYCSAFFRFPEGAYSDYALSEVISHGFRVCFWSLAYADWDENNQKGADYAYETIMSRLHPGAVMLLHSVSADNAAALADVIDAARAQGYEFRSLSELP